MQPTLEFGAVRATDPPTSKAAARVNRSGVTERILRVFSGGEQMHDDALCRRLPLDYPPTVKSARSRLSNAGVLVAVPDVYGKSDRGYDQQVWELARARPVERVTDPRGRV